MKNRQFSLGIVGAAMIIMCVMAGIFGVGALALRSQRQALNLIKVPGDHPTIQAAIDAAQPGDIIQVSPGTYNENLRLDKAVSLTAANFDQINPVNNNTVIDGQTGSTTITIPSGLSQMPAIRGFVIRNGNTAIQTGSPFIAEFNYFNGSNVLVHYQAGGGGANRNNVYFGSRDDAIRLENIDRPLLVENNRIMYAGGDGIEIDIPAAAIPAALTEVDIWNNMILGSRADGIQFIDHAGSPPNTNRRFVITGNLVANSQRAGLGVISSPATAEDYSGADSQEAIRVFNNTFYGNDVGISGGDNLVAFNNIIGNSVARGVSRVQGQAGANSVVAHTLFFGNAVDAQDATLGEGIITGLDPLFAASPNPGPDGTWATVDDDFSGLLLPAGSPAIDRGVTQYLAASGEAVPADPLSGFTGAAPDLGWREFGSPAFITATPTLVPTMTLEASPTSPSLTGLPTWTPVVTTATSGSPTETPAVTATSTPGTPASPTEIPSTTATPTAGVTPNATATPQFAVLSIIPNSAQIGTTANLSVFGVGFQDGATVTFEGALGTAPEVTAVQVVNSTTIAVTVNVTADASFGPQVWDVRVTNPDQVYVVLPAAFTVTLAQ